MNLLAVFASTLRGGEVRGWEGGEVGGWQEREGDEKIINTGEPRTLLCLQYVHICTIHSVIIPLSPSPLSHTLTHLQHRWRLRPCDGTAVVCPVGDVPESLLDLSKPPPHLVLPTMAHTTPHSHCTEHIKWTTVAVASHLPTPSFINQHTNTTSHIHFKGISN